MRIVEVIDHLGDFWQFMLPAVYKRQANGFTVMWVYVASGPWHIAKHYQQIPLPVFTEWWEE